MNSIFYLKPNSSVDDEADRINILLNLIQSPYSISSIETDYVRKGIGKRAVREITRTTVYTLVFIINIQITLSLLGLIKGVEFIYSHLILHPFCVSIWLYVLFFFIIRRGFLFYGFYVFKRRSENKDKDKLELEKAYSAWLINGSSYFIRLTKYFYKIIPFTFRTIWIWTLVFGVATVFTSDDLKIDFQNKIDPIVFNNFTSGLLKSIIITIISYIATNVIHELLQLREQYVEGKEEMSSLKEGILKSTNNLDEVVSKTNNIKEQILSVLTFIDASNSIQSLVKQIGKKKLIILDSLVSDYIKGIAKFTKEITKKIKAGRENEILLSLVSSYNSLLSNQVIRVEKEEPILTQFANLGTISKNLVKDLHGYITTDRNKLDKDKELVFYALQLYSPSGFVDKLFEEDKDNDEANKEWREFINYNIINNHVIRYFAVIEDAVRQEIAKEYSEALEAFKTNNDDKKLTELLRKIPYLGELTSISEENVKNSLDDTKYFCDVNLIENLKPKNGEIIDQVLVAKDKQSNDFVEFPLRQLLDSIIHRKGSCMIRKFNRKELDELIIDNLETLTSGEKPTNNLIDFLAIREQTKDKVYGEWIFCVKSIYDKDIDTAKVEFLYKQANNAKQWDMTKKALNNIFFLGFNSTIKTGCMLQSDEGICTEKNYCRCDENKIERIIPIINY